MICDACKLGFRQTTLYPACLNCGGSKSDKTAKLCEDCSFDLDQCEICRGPLPEDPDEDSLEAEPTDDELDAIEDEEESEDSEDEPESDPPPDKDDDCGKDDC